MAKGLLFDEEALLDAFSEEELTAGKEYQQAGHVVSIDLDKAKGRIEARVRGSRASAYRVEISIASRKGLIFFDGNCGCVSGFNCKHVVASLWDCLVKRLVGETVTEAPVVQSDADPFFAEEVPPAVEAVSHDEAPYLLVYVLHTRPDETTKHLFVTPSLVKRLRGGGYGKARPFNLNDAEQAVFATAADLRLCHWINLLSREGSVDDRRARGQLFGRAGMSLLQKLLETTRCHWQSASGPLLSLGPLRSGEFYWTVEKTGLQRLACHMPGSNNIIFPLSEPWYIDLRQKQCGPLQTDLPAQLACRLLETSELKPDQVEEFRQLLKEKAKQPKGALPTSFTQKKRRKIKPKPVVKLFMSSVEVKPQTEDWWEHNPYAELALAEVLCQYDELLVAASDEETKLQYAEGEVLYTIARERAAEAAIIQDFCECAGLQTLESQKEIYEVDATQKSWFLIASPKHRHRMFHFCHEMLPVLRDKGWRVEIDASFPYQMIEEVPEWYTEVDDVEGNTWFDLELGVMIGGKKINLLPLLLDCLQQRELNQETDVLSLSDEEMLSIRLKDGRYLPVPVARLRPIFSMLTELYDSKALTADERIRLSLLRASQLKELREALPEVKTRWLGSKRLIQLGERLRDFTEIKEVDLPKNFHTVLRPYQYYGLCWLQFLRQYQLAGILADDMGLGKTVQTLAHLAVEQEAGRIKQPCLLVAPTSLVTNWFLEAKRFTPKLKVLVLHGQKRRRHFRDIEKYDLVVTTYALLSRDEEVYLGKHYHYLILDEAQYIKNPKAKATQIVHRIHADNRLCLTGTPMENNLTELWSLFHFILPGLLGEQKQFKKLFRDPIELDQNRERQHILSTRVKPFVLRRDKKEVIAELPDKTEIIRRVSLDGVQRDLYETIRLSLHERVMDAIAAQGYGKSQIVLLDALLKLRQVCCDPRLVKMKAAERAHGSSAKLQLLMDMLPDLISSGHRILLFSQFTSMLKLIEAELCKEEIPYVKLTGQTKDRTTPIQQFQNKEVPLFLISLKAGGVGLNLTAADTVIHYDPWWNPAVERQATDRAHRIGQDKEVFVFKLITLGTVEEKILALQEKKKALLENIFQEEESGESKLTSDDLQALFMPLE